MKIFCEPETITRHRRLFDCWVTIFLLALLAGPGSTVAQETGGTLRTTFNNPTPAAYDIFGGSVAALGTDRVLIGAEGAGEAYLFNLTGTLLTTFTNPTPSGDSFGATVAAVGNGQVLIGAYNFTASYQGQPRQIGRAYLLTTNGVLLTTFTNPSPATVQAFSFGGVAAVGSDHVLIAGVPGGNIGEPSSGGVFLFRTNGALITTFTNPTPAIANSFGWPVAALGSDRVIIGAPYDNTGASGAGLAYLYSTNGTMLTTFTNPAPLADDNFGTGIAAVGNDRVLISAVDYGGVRGGGTAYLFNTNGTLLTTFINPNPAVYDYFGWAVAAVGTDRVLIGAYQDNTGAFRAGVAYLFSTNGTLLNTITNPTPASQDFFGVSVAAVGNDHVIIGSVWKDTGATDAGAAYLFALSDPALSIARANALITISWPSPSTGFVLQQNTDLNTANWTTPTETVTDNGATKSVNFSPAPGNRFFRLFKP
ncbi:MAG: hypothetical protein IH623_25895 [Verrucomicrobia bacterium]|nr:hypothetical protein [Verrucomicrobiota bacterium]